MYQNRFVLHAGVYPAAVTPFDEKGRIDFAAMARLLAFFESSGCIGAVLAGTNGEGPSLSAVEKRDLIHKSARLRGKLDLILGIATSSLDEAIWLCKQAAIGEASAVLVMPPGYFRSVSKTAIGDWFLRLMDASPLPVLVYNFPKMTGITISPELMARLSEHANMAGAKDSSGEIDNISSYRQATRVEQSLFVGDETLLLRALGAGWSGTISGAANSIPEWISRVVFEWSAEGLRESAETKFELILPVIKALRSVSQPAHHKEVLRRRGVLPSADVRLPLELADPVKCGELVTLLRDRLGVI